MQKVELVYAAHAELAEGPLWHDDVLWWVDIEAGTLNRLDPATGLNTSRAMGGCLGAASPCGNDLWLLAQRGEFSLLNWATGKQTAFASLGGLPRLQRLNDGKCDPAGRFWVGSLHRKRARHEACLYALESDGRIRLSLGRLSLSNGLAWSCDGRTMFHIDTLERTVTAFDFDTAHGVLGQPRLLARIPASMGSPDGVAIDCENQLWIALWGGGAKGAQACDEIDWQHNLDLNLASHWRLAKLCKPHLEKSGHGVIQIMTSNHAYATLPGCFPYNVTKTALTGLVRSLAVEWGPKVRVVGLAPGFVETPGNDEWFASFPDPAAERAKTIRRHPAGQLGTCEEIGAWSAFLSSNFAVFSTGTVFVIDGGRLALLQDD